MKRASRKLIAILVLAVILLLLFFPAAIPFLSEETRTLLAQSMRSAFTLSTPGGFGVMTVITALAAIAALYIVDQLLNCLFRHMRKKEGRSGTVAGLLMSVTHYAVFVCGFAWVLSLLGMDMAGVLTSLGVVTLVVGFGAQSLIEDIITGIFIIFEGQYNIGDVIVIDNFRGKVTNIGVRTTSLVDAGGNVKIVNNSDVRNLQNRSRQLSVAICDVGIGYDVAIPDVEAVLKTGLPLVQQNAPTLFSSVEYMGVQELGESAVILRIIAYVKEDDIFIGQRALNRAVKMLFDENHITVPFHQMDVHTDK